jgi:hypothetical protein
MTTIRLSGGGLGSDTMDVRCDLSQAASAVQANYRTEPDSTWVPTQYQCADARHTVEGLAEIGRRLAARACEMPIEAFGCDWRVID